MPSPSAGKGIEPADGDVVDGVHAERDTATTSCRPFVLAIGGKEFKRAGCDVDTFVEQVNGMVVTRSVCAVYVNLDAYSI